MKTCRCGGESRVLETRVQPNSDLLRRRQCAVCGQRWVTRESLAGTGGWPAAHIGGLAASGDGVPLRAVMRAVLAELRVISESVTRIAASGGDVGACADVLEAADMRLSDLAVEVESAWAIERAP